MTTASQHTQFAKAVRKFHRRLKGMLSSTTLKAALTTHAHDVQEFEAALISNAIYHDNAAEYQTRQDEQEAA